MPAKTIQPGAAARDAAVLMLLFGEEAAAEVMRHLSPVEVQHVGAAMYAVDEVPDSEIDRITEGFLQRVAGETGLGLGRAEFVRSVMTRALGADRAQSVITRINPDTAERPIELLDWMDSASVHEMIADEPPQVMALVVACLPYAQAAEVLALLPEPVQPEVIRRVAKLGAVTPEALRELEGVLQRKFKATTSASGSQLGGVRAAARIMNHARSGAEGRILRDLRRDDKDLMAAIQDNMFVFDNLGKSDDRSLQTLLRGIEPDRLALALKGADEGLRARLLSCLSGRAAAGIRDEMEAMGPVRLSEVIEAQKEIVATARRLADEGTIVLAGRGGEELV
jgi:flagellar motor switch protein FliG